MTAIQRLNLAMRNMAGLNKSDAKLMHITTDDRINSVVPLARYNLRTGDGAIFKYTLGDNFVKLSKLRKIGNKYVEYVQQFIGDPKYLK